MPRVFCCLDATARDWLRVGLLILNKGTVNNQQIVSTTWIDQMTTPSILNPNYGYLTWLGTEHKERRAYNRKSSATAFHKEPFIDNDVIYLMALVAKEYILFHQKNWSSLELVTFRWNGMIHSW